MNEAFRRTGQEIVVPRAERDTIASMVVIEWARSRGRRSTHDSDAAQVPIPPAELTEDTEYWARVGKEQGDPYHLPDAF